MTWKDVESLKLPPAFSQISSHLPAQERGKFSLEGTVNTIQSLHGIF